MTPGLSKDTQNHGQHRSPQVYKSPDQTHNTEILVQWAVHLVIPDARLNLPIWLVWVCRSIHTYYSPPRVDRVGTKSKVTQAQERFQDVIPPAINLQCQTICSIQRVIHLASSHGHRNAPCWINTRVWKPVTNVASTPCVQIIKFMKTTSKSDPHARNLTLETCILLINQFLGLSIKWLIHTD